MLWSARLECFGKIRRSVIPNFTTMKKSAFLVLSLCLTLAFVLGSCTPPVDHSAKVTTLDSLYADVEAAELRFNTINRFNTDQFFENIEAELSLVQDNFEGSMDRDMAKTLADYRSITKLVKNFSSRHKRLGGEIARTKAQLRGLTQALSDGATQDSQGNQFTPEYVNKVFSQEQKVAKSLIEEIDEMIDRLNTAQTRYDELHPEVEVIIASLEIETEE